VVKSALLIRSVRPLTQSRRQGMQRTLSCHRHGILQNSSAARLSTRTCLNRATSPSNPALSIPTGKITTTTTTPPRRTLLTFPDLSKLSPFGNNSPKGNDFDSYHEKVTLPFSKEVLFDVVSNVNEYEEFVPYCAQSRVNEASKRQINDDTLEFNADLGIGYGQLKESYTSKVTVVKGKSVKVS
jgi:hypothetical protein